MRFGARGSRDGTAGEFLSPWGATARGRGRCRRFDCVRNPVESAERCAELVRLAIDQGLLPTAAALAAHGRVRFPESLEVCLADAAALEALGFREQAVYRYREALRLRPMDVNALIGLGANLVESGSVKAGVRELLGAASVTSEERLLDELAGYLTRLVETARRPATRQRRALPVLP